MLDRGGLPVLAHVRFPLGGFHMVMLSENPEMIQQNLDQIWKMLTTVDLKKIDAGETNYLFTVVALHTYAFYFQHQELFSAKTKPKPIEDKKSSEELALVKDVGIGATMDVAIEGSYAFAIGRRKLSILDISNPTQPDVIGTLSGLGHVRQIVVNNNIAYITSREDGLFIVSVKDRKHPQLLSHYDTIEFATGVAISGDVLFVACRNYGVELIDVTSPSKPMHLSTVRTGEAQSVVARGRWLYVGIWATSEVVTVDVNNPRSPKIKSRVRLDGFGDGVDVQGKYLFAATGHHSRKLAHRTVDDPGFGNGHGLEIFDITDPATPQFVSRVKFPRLYNMGNDMWGVTVAGNHAFVADTHNGIFVVDITNKKQPTIVGHRKLPYIKSRKLHAFVGGLALTKNSIYVAGGETDLHIFAAPDPIILSAKETVQPLTITSLPTNEEDQRFDIYRPDGQVHAVDFHDNRAVVACGSAGVHVVEIKPTIKLISKFKTNGFVTDVAVSQKQVLIAAGTDGLLICKMSPQGQLIQLGKYHVKGKAIKQVEVPLAGKYALVQVGANNLHIIDISNPAQPQRVLDTKRHGLLYGDQTMRGIAENRYACVFWHVSGMHWFDMKSKPHPTPSGDNIPLRIGSVNGLVEHHGKTLATTRGGYLILNRQDRRPLKDFVVQRIGKLRHHLGTPTIFGNMLYAANRVTGTITITDISNITTPKLIKQFTLPGNPGRVVLHHGKMVIPDGYHGLLIATSKKP